MSVRSLPAALRACARLQPNDPAFTFMNYERDWDGVAETLTWSQLYRRTLNVARELSSCGAVGDRAVILAPQGLEYIVAFLGALQAGRIAVPLSVPQGGASDDRATSVLRDASPVAILTTSPVIDDVTQHVSAQSAGPAPSIIELDRLDLDASAGSGAGDENYPATAYLQYTSGSTREPAGVELSHQNLRTNFEQLMSGYFADTDGLAPPDATLVSWLPFYHDMGLVLGVCAPILGGYQAVLTSPVSFLQLPARWMQMLATSSHAFSAAPNFAFELAAKKVSDDDMAGHDLGNVLTILSGSERVQPATLKRFADRFARFNLQERVLRPSYGLAEATVYVSTSRPAQPPEILDFEAESLTAGQAKRCESGAGTQLVSYVLPRSPLVRVVDPDTCTECPEGTVGEIWVHGDNVAIGYWNKPEESERTFGGKLASPSEGTPEGPWLRTGDSGFIEDAKMFIIGRIKDLLIVYGRNHSPDDIEATIQEITRSRCAAISVPGDRSTEKLVAIIELRKRGDSAQDTLEILGAIKREVTSALSNSHGLSVADLVLVAPGSIPTTTSGKVRRAACVEQYRQQQFARLDA
ncbi:long-chain-fatty-acid--AMP ligase FadD28 [Mycobacterium marinum]|uniref:fatty-acid--AMP ligase FAAL28/FadD28 n=1 Tax=Mycobacterium marinum TaxID=1781 RepID=UPI000E3B89E9|nr:fatty-acid--AMP ligase FAAL28/FadD28 [Mycobacterium marinum]GJN96041.1 long-chain-fatty-acid--AMP ligase FadD28 [Mycobacterium marinum]GJO03731.1 long-chain-fatty-acid--AMP ligase FadD28 [Mycobacterium marinum]GJO04173.1 long-chain-fatty-acid--AMP ligase FadD28 [Mycobacterium marinum]GJO13118.1 long-chain-fatty-acid--AMP ligase FadD28 [Mycobacterium marinum]GJO18202.1 long-chain-fatty-acid--AMP ligase FadD28 [Mycobacterium marinum]